MGVGVGGRSSALWGVVLGLLLGGCAGGPAAQGGAGASDAVPLPDREYRLYVANESSDVVSRVVFTPEEGAWVEREIRVGIMPADTDAPHGLAVAPGGEHFYVTLAHGTPYGWLWKFQAGPDTLVDRVRLGRFPASAGLDPQGTFVFVVNFNLHGDMVPSDLSVVHAGTMQEMTRVRTCLMPHGSRVDPSGRRHYSVCMHSDQLVEVGLTDFQVTGRYSLAPGSEGPLSLDDLGDSPHAHAHDPGPMVHIPEEEGRPLPDPGPHHAEGEARCSPTWVAPGRGARGAGFVYVACNAADQVLEVDVGQWEVTRRWETGRGPYNVEVTPDGGTLLVTLRGEGGLELLDLEGDGPRVSLETSRGVTHGVVVEPDGRYAFVSNESVGADRGTMDVFDLEARRRVATVELRHQPTGIDFWRSDPGGQGPVPGS